MPPIILLQWRTVALRRTRHADQLALGPECLPRLAAAAHLPASLITLLSHDCTDLRLEVDLLLEPVCLHDVHDICKDLLLVAQCGAGSAAL